MACSKFSLPTLLYFLLTAFNVCANSELKANELVNAAKANDTQRIFSLLADKPDVDAQANDGMTPLLWAVYHDNVAIAKKLVASEADPDISNRYSVTPLSLACENGNFDLAKLLIEAGADVNSERNGRETALMTASRTGNPSVVRLLLNRGAKVETKEWKGQTAVMWAAAEGHTEVVKLLLEAGANSKQRLKSGFNPFFFAVRSGDIPTVLTLLASGHDVNSTMKPDNKSGRGPRHGTSALMLAVENGHFDLAIELIKRGADPDDQRSGFAVLHAITWVRKANRGDNPAGDPEPQGRGERNSMEFVRELIVDHKADVNLQLKNGRGGKGRINHKGATPLLFAADTADLPLMKLLVELGADPHLHNVDDCSPLMVAAGIGSIAPGEEAGSYEECIAAVEYLLSLDADINHVDRNGESAMHGAAYKCNPKMVHYLNDHGADFKIWSKKNRHGWSPWLIAQGYRPGNFKPAPATMSAIREVMLSHGVDPPKEKVRIQGPDYD